METPLSDSVVLSPWKIIRHMETPLGNSVAFEPLVTWRLSNSVALSPWKIIRHVETEYLCGFEPLEDSLQDVVYTSHGDGPE